jgi:hypothetical protein
MSRRGSRSRSRSRSRSGSNFSIRLLGPTTVLGITTHQHLTVIDFSHCYTSVFCGACLLRYYVDIVAIAFVRNKFP